MSEKVVSVSEWKAEFLSQAEDKPCVPPLFDAAHIRKLSVRPGDVLVLTVPESMEEVTGEMRERSQENLRVLFGIEDLYLWILPPGARLDVLRKAEPFKSETPAEETGGYTIVGEGAAEFAEQLKNELASSASPDPGGIMMTWQPDQPAQSVSDLMRECAEADDQIRAAMQKTLSEALLKQTDEMMGVKADPALSVQSLCHLRITIREGDGRLLLFVNDEWASCKFQRERGVLSYVGSFRVAEALRKPYIELSGRIAQIECPDTQIVFDAIVMEQLSEGVYSFKSNGAPTKLPVTDSCKEIPMHGDVANEPQQADSAPSKVQWREFI